MTENIAKKTSMGMDENVASTLCYALGWVTGLVFFLIEKENKTVRFHAMQSIIVFGALQVLNMVFAVMLGPLSMLLSLAGIGLWVLLMVKAYQGEYFKLPFVGDIAEQQVYKGQTPPAPQPGAQAPQSQATFAPPPPAAAPAFTPPPSHLQPAKKIFCTQCGKEAASPGRFCEQCGAPLGGGAPQQPQTPPLSGGKEPILTAVEAELSRNPSLSVSRSNTTDLEIKSVLADANWGVGKRKVEYSACLLAKEEEQLVLYWEMIKESGSGMTALGGFKVEGFKVGKAISGKTMEMQWGPDGKKVVDYNWDYGKTRALVENVVKSQGWKFKVVLMKNKAMYG